MDKKLAKGLANNNQQTNAYSNQRLQNYGQNLNQRSVRQSTSCEFVKYFLSSDEESEEQDNEGAEEEEEEQEQEESDDEHEDYK